MTVPISTSTPDSWKPSGVLYCLVHHGITNEDSSNEACDFSSNFHDPDDLDAPPCRYTELHYRS